MEDDGVDIDKSDGLAGPDIDTDDDEDGTATVEVEGEVCRTGRDDEADEGSGTDESVSLT